MSTAIEAARAKTKGKRMLKAALEAYGEDDFTLTEWNEKRTIAEQEGTWTWKKSQSNPNATIKDRFQSQEIQDALKIRFVDLNSAMEQEMHATLTAISNNPRSPSAKYLNEDQCRWREKINGKYFQCSNLIHKDQKNKKKQVTNTPGSSKVKHCLWHMQECVDPDHPFEEKQIIEVPNDEGLCAFCYEKTSSSRENHQKIPTRRPAVKIPGVYPVDLGKISKKVELLSNHFMKDLSNTKKLTAQSLCNWSKEHFEDAYIWKCKNRVLAHPILAGSFLSYCGFHASKCIQEYNKKAQKCTSSMEKRNQFGLCRNHFEAHVSTMSYQEKKQLVLVDSEFDVPGVYECKKKKKEIIQVRSHPLAPRCPPPSSSSSGLDGTGRINIVTMNSNTEPTGSRTINAVSTSNSSLPVRLFNQYKQDSRVLLNSISSQWSTRQLELQRQINERIQSVLALENPVSSAVRDIIWKINYCRKGPRLAKRIQKIYRGNLARKRVHMIRNEARAIRRLRALRAVQRVARGFLGRKAFKKEHDRVFKAIPIIQRCIRGGLGRKRFRWWKAAMKLQRAYRAKRQRMIAWSLREEIQYMRNLQLESQANLREAQEWIAIFKRKRASRLLVKQMRQWKIRKAQWEEEQKQKLIHLMATIKLQRMYRHHLKYLLIKKRYLSARTIQRYIRGHLTRVMWTNDPGLLSICSYISKRTGFEYGKVIVLNQKSRSYSVKTRQIRRHFGALAIQRMFRGHLGRLEANDRWRQMEELWKWIGLNNGEQGRDKYGFLLPSGFYDPNPALHMVPKAHWIQPNRGFSYKYQLVLDMIQDRDGKRARTLNRDPKELRLTLEAPINNDDVPNTAEMAGADDVMARMGRIELPEEHDVRLQGISEAMARLPVGARVFVLVNHFVGKTEEEMDKDDDTEEEKEYKQKLRRVPIIHPAQITKVHKNTELFDVEYAPGLFSGNGVAIFQEENVPSSRIQTHYRPNSRAAPVPASRVGKAGRSQRRAELEELARASMASFEALKEREEAEPDKPLESVSALVERLRETHENRDLLREQSAFVDFCFRNRLLLQSTWLQVVSHIRNGNPHTNTKGMPRRAAKIQELMEQLKCFTHDASANQKEATSPIVLAHSGSTSTSSSSQMPEAMLMIRPETSSGTADMRVKDQIPNLPVPMTRASTRDDWALEELGKQFQSTQALHQLVYELKTLPRERRREEILEVVTRNQRSFVCGHPGCGRCFSSHEAARLHQQSIHESQERMALGDPLVDQYMHTYWPPQSPWSNPQSRDSSTRGSMVGYYPCPHQGCGTEFLTRRLLQAHLNQVHSVQKQEDNVTQQLQRAQNLTQAQVLWLGSYTICSSNLHEKLGLSSKYKQQVVPCLLHPRTPLWSCITCQSQQNRPKLPCRLYSAVCLPHLGQQDRGTTLRPEDVDTYTIFSMSDPEFCPGVYVNEIDYAEAKGETTNRPDRQEDRHRLVYVKLFALCRDVDGAEWLVGHGYHPPHAPRSKEEALLEGYDGYEVFLDEERVIFAKLTSIKGAALVRHCSKSHFYRKFFKKDTPNGMRNGTAGGGGRLTSTLLHEPPHVVRYCRRTITPAALTQSSVYSVQSIE